MLINHLTKLPTTRVLQQEGQDNETSVICIAVLLLGLDEYLFGFSRYLQQIFSISICFGVGRYKMSRLQQYLDVVRK